MKKCLIIDPWSQESQNVTEEKENRESNNEVYSISFEGFREVLFGTSVDCPGNSESHDCNHSSEHRYVDEVFYDACKNLLESRESFHDLTFILSCFECFTGGIGLIDTGTSGTRNLFGNDNGCSSRFVSGEFSCRGS